MEKMDESRRRGTEALQHLVKEVADQEGLYIGKYDLIAENFEVISAEVASISQMG